MKFAFKYTKLLFRYSWRNKSSSLQVRKETFLSITAKGNKGTFSKYISESGI